jgi:hypothetical protein
MNKFVSLSGEAKHPGFALVPLQVDPAALGILLPDDSEAVAGRQLPL